MNGWKEYKLGEVCELLDCLHKTPVYSVSGYPMVRVTDVKNGALDVGRCLRVSEDVYKAFLKGYKPKIGDIVFSRVGSFGNSCIVKKEINFCIGQNTTLIIPKEIDAFFTFYYLISSDAQSQIHGFAGGSTQPTISMKSIKEIVVPFPPRPEQTAIAEVLSSLDDKIDLLHRQNKTLEQLAETLFRQWFVEEAEEQSGKFVLLGDLVESVSITHKFPEKEVVFLNTSDVYLGDVINHKKELVNGLPGQAKKSIQKNDILFSEIRPANGRWAYIDFDADNYVVSTKLMVLRSKEKVSQAFIYFYLTNSSVVAWLQMLAESRSGTFPQITFEQIRDLKIQVPSEKILTEASKICTELLLKIKFNTQQIRTLTQLRDILLPKLMSGEVRVKK
ncbi:MAG: restriction endonuclease subunit S [Cyclobacteriaceae bacterium]